MIDSILRFKVILTKFKDLLIYINTAALIIVLILLGFILRNNNRVEIRSTPSPSPVAAEKGFQPYLNSFKKVSFEYPEGWDKKEFDNNVFVEFKKADKWDFNVYEFALTSNPNLDEYGKTVTENLSKNKDYKLLEGPSATMLAKLPAFKISYIATFDKTYKIMQVYTLKKNLVYCLTYRSSSENFDTELPNIQKVLDSFTILD